MCSIHAVAAAVAAPCVRRYSSTVCSTLESEAAEMSLQSALTARSISCFLRCRKDEASYQQGWLQTLQFNLISLFSATACKATYVNACSSCDAGKQLRSRQCLLFFKQLMTAVRVVCTLEEWQLVCSVQSCNCKRLHFVLKACSACL